MNFEKNKSLEQALKGLNEKLYAIEAIEMKKVAKPVFPNLLLFGNARTGSTLFFQWIASQNNISYPSNFLSRFYKAPYIGALIYNILTLDKYQYRNEFQDINTKIEFLSSIGKTQGLKSPHEFWYFWRRFIDFADGTPMNEDEFLAKFDFRSANRELALIQKAFGKPFLIKGKIMNYYLKSLHQNLDNVIFIHMYRNPLPTIRSIIKAREKWNGSRTDWFSWKPREYDSLKEMDIYHQVAGQVYFIDKEILENKSILGNRYLPIKYEDFCENPKKIYQNLIDKIDFFSDMNFETSAYESDIILKASNPVSDEDSKIIDAYKYFENKYGKLDFN